MSRRLTLADLARFPRPGTQVPQRLRFSPDGCWLFFLWSERGDLVLSLWALDVETGERRVIAGPEPEQADETRLSLEEQLRRERARLRAVGVTTFDVATKARTVTLLWPTPSGLAVSRDFGAPRLLPGTEGALDARLSPDGSRVAFHRNGGLWVMGLDADAPVPVALPEEEGISYGAAEFIAQEELDRSEGFWWSPDGRRLAFQRTDERHIPPYPIVHLGRPQPAVEYHRYPFAGAANAKIELFVRDLEAGTTAKVELPALAAGDEYLARVWWRDEERLVVYLLARDQQRADAFQFEFPAGSPPAAAVTEGFSPFPRAPLGLWHDEQQPWINLDHHTRFLASGEFVRASESRGYKHLYLHAPDGRLVRQLTDGPWMVTDVLGVDEGARAVYFAATKETPLERHLYRVSLEGGEPERVTAEPGWHAGVLSPEGRWLVDLWSSLQRPWSAWLLDLRTGERRALVPSEDISPDRLGVRPPTLFQVTAADGQTSLDAALYLPDGDQPAAGWPLIVSVYGGPHAQRVANDWSLTVDLRAQYLAQRGFAVLKVDNRGSAGRGLAFEAAIARRLGTVELDDQVAAVRALIDRGLVDPARVGVYGWSYGGYMACLAATKAGDLFRCAVAGAPVTDWDGYDTAYTERYMGTPTSNPEGYREASVLTHARNLKAALLLVHGGVDENVHFRHTARLIVALTEAQKPYELLLFPEERHMPRDAAGLEYQERRVMEFLGRHLGGSLVDEPGAED
ncbi:MAG: DPP IV N-terminal domain-containing protein [Chloroflexota bacterium]|nr:DPP IV N-terminal domain-containing protein [Chloroflexota bacterium]